MKEMNFFILWEMVLTGFALKQDWQGHLTELNERIDLEELEDIS